MALYYRPAMEYARNHNLPIAFRSWNYDRRIMENDDWTVQSPLDEKPHMIINNRVTDTLDPYGPLKPWIT